MASRFQNKSLRNKNYFEKKKKKITPEVTGVYYYENLVPTLFSDPLSDWSLTCSRLFKLVTLSISQALVTTHRSLSLQCTTHNQPPVPKELLSLF